MSISNYGSLHVVNSSATGNQLQATAAGLADGTIIVTWYDSHLHGIRAQYFDALGNPVGAQGEFAPNLFYPGTQDTELPRVVSDPSSPDLTGGYILGSVDVDLGENLVSADTFNVDLVHLSAFNVGAGANSNYTDMVVKRFGSNIAYTFEDATHNLIYYKSAGTTLHIANADTHAPQTSPDLAVLADGSHYVISWWDEEALAVKFRLFDNTDTPLAGEGVAGLVGTTADGSEPFGYRGDAVAALTGGNFVVVWNSKGAGGTDSDGYGIQASVFNASGTAVKYEFQINTTTADSQRYPSVVGLLDGGFAVAWTDFSTGEGRTVMRTFDASGNATSNEFVVDGAGHHDWAPQLTLLGDGRIAVTWEADQSVPQDTSGSHVEMQIVDPRTAGVTLVANPIDSDLVGTPFNDLFIATDGSDRFTGNGGFDTVSYQKASEGAHVDLRVVGDYQGVTSTMAARLIGIHGVIGSAFGDHLTGGNGNDALYGRNGNDVLTGGRGADILNGGTGNDTMRGGPGVDRFVFNTIIAVAGADRILDFQHGIDKIELAHSVFTAINPSGVLNPGMFHEGPAQTAAQHIIYHPGNGTLIYDTNGSALGGQYLIATLAPGLTLTNTDFLVIPF